MLIGMIRPRGTTSTEVTGTSLEDVQTQLEAQRLDWYELLNAPAEKVKGAALIETTGTFERRDDVLEIEADTIDGVRPFVPRGWQLVSVREA